MTYGEFQRVCRTWHHPHWRQEWPSSAKPRSDLEANSFLHIGTGPEEAKHDAFLVAWCHKKRKSMCRLRAWLLHDRDSPNDLWIGFIRLNLTILNQLTCVNWHTEHRRPTTDWHQLSRPWWCSIWEFFSRKLREGAANALWLIELLARRGAQAWPWQRNHIRGG